MKGSIVVVKWRLLGPNFYRPTNNNYLIDCTHDEYYELYWKVNWHYGKTVV